MPLDAFVEEIERAVNDVRDLFVKEKEDEPEHAKL